MRLNGRRRAELRNNERPTEVVRAERHLNAIGSAQPRLQAGITIRRHRPNSSARIRVRRSLRCGCNLSSLKCAAKACRQSIENDRLENDDSMIRNDVFSPLFARLRVFNFGRSAFFGRTARRRPQFRAVLKKIGEVRETSASRRNPSSPIYGFQPTNRRLPIPAI